LKPRVYEIVGLGKGLRTSRGYCLEFSQNRRSYIVKDAFTLCILFVPFGELACYESWKGATRLPRSTHEIVETEWRPWMELRSVDVLLAVKLCMECAEPLPRGGFRRT
jgi:hypothetical protein